MKRILRGAMLVLLCALLLTVAAEVPELKTYVIEPYGFAIPMPADYAVFTHDMSPDDPALAMFDVTPEFADDLLDETNFDLVAVNTDLTREIDARYNVGMAAASQADGETFEQYAEDLFEAGDAANGNTYDSYSIETVGDRKVICIEVHATADPDMCAYRAVAVFGDDLVVVQNTSMNGPVNDDDRALTLAIVAGAGEDAAEPAEESAAASVFDGASNLLSGTALTDDESHITFELGDKWLLLPSEEENNRVYLYRDDALVSTNFVYYDLWGNPYVDEMLQLLGFKSRSDITVDALGEDLVAMLLGTDAEKVNYRSFGTTTFACSDAALENKRTEELSGTSIYSALCTDNGYIYVFSYITMGDNFDGMSDYEDLLSTVTFR